MSLPILSTPKYTVSIPSTGVSVEYRPFLVKEEKILLVAQESGDQGEIMNAIKDVIRACTYDKVKPDTLTTFDLEYLFIKLRSKSVGEISTIGIECSECKTKNTVDINLDEIEVQGNIVKSKKVMLTDKIGVVLKYMSVKDMSRITTKKNSSTVEMMTDTIISCIDSIFDGDTIYAAENSSRSELEAFINSLSRSQMKLIEEFIMDIPKVKHDVKFTCVSCKHANEISLTGAQTFFE